MTDTPNQTEPPDQPDGIEDDSHDLPDPQRAAMRVNDFLSAYGDGLIEVEWSEGYLAQCGVEAKPLYARDLQALADAVRLTPQDEKRDEAQPKQCSCEDAERTYAELEATYLTTAGELSRLRAENATLVWLHAEQAHLNAGLRAYTETTRYHQDRHAAAVREVERINAAYDSMRNGLMDMERKRDAWKEAAGVDYRDNDTTPEEARAAIAQAGTGDTAQPGDDVIDRAARDLHRWNTEDTWHPRFVIHDLGDQDEDPYVALVRKVAGLLAAHSDGQEDECGLCFLPRSMHREPAGGKVQHDFRELSRQEPDQGNGDTEGDHA